MQILPEWPSFACKLYPHGHQPHAHASGQLPAKLPVFASTLREQLFELKNEDAI
jgi:hypothetical protein